MPTATAFNALGAGNGFAFCLSKINVNDRGDGNPYFKYKVLTLSDAMKLYWNIASTTASAEAPKSGGGTLTAALSLSDVLAEPKERVCGHVITGRTDTDTFTFVTATIRSPIVYKLYNGNTSDENNFLGYGVDQLVYVSVEANSASEFIDVIYTGLRAYDNSNAGAFTATNVIVNGVTIFKLEADNSTTAGIQASISATDSYTY